MKRRVTLAHTYLNSWVIFISNISNALCSALFVYSFYRYKIIRDGHGKTGQGRRKREYFAVLEELFAGDPAVQPTVVISSTPTFTTPPPPPPPDQETPSTSATMTTPPVKPKTKKDKLDDKLDEIIKLQKETIAFQKEINIEITSLGNSLQPWFACLRAMSSNLFILF